ncbi:MAG: DUF3079 domain-containing protein [Acidobacteriota bacterium]
MKRIPLHPRHPERICWGCDRFCPADDLRCGNGTVRTMHPSELFGEDWVEWSQESNQPGQAPDSPEFLKSKAQPARLRSIPDC